MEIELLLHNHCIETAAKRMYAGLLSICLKNGMDSDLEEGLESKVEGLKYFLENTDFGYLRSRFPELNGFPLKKVMLRFPENFKDPIIVCDDRHIVPQTKQQKGAPCINV